MSSWLNKLKALVNANLRGPRQYKREPKASSETADSPTPTPEVSEAPARQHKLPEVTEGTQPAIPATQSSDTPIAGASRVETPQKDEERRAALEEERIVDLLKGEKS